MHLASLAGAWLASVCGFGGMRDHGDALSFAPGLPPALSRMAFRLVVRGRRLAVEMTATGATYTLSGGDPLEILHHCSTVVLVGGEPLELACPASSDLPPVQPPPGREPMRRGIGADDVSRDAQADR